MPRRLSLALATALALAACSDVDSAGGPDTSGDMVPARCEVTDAGGEERFWEAMTTACRVSDDGDRRQARALREVLSAWPAEEVAAFHRAMVDLHRRLLATELPTVADELCFPGLGLGQDLGADYRSWLVAQGQAVVEWVEEDPARLVDLPGARRGCGMGESISYAAVSVHEQKTAGDPTVAELEPLELLAP